MNFNEVYEDTITSVSQAVRTGNIEQVFLRLFLKTKSDNIFAKNDWPKLN